MKYQNYEIINDSEGEWIAKELLIPGKIGTIIAVCNSKKELYAKLDIIALREFREDQNKRSESYTDMMNEVREANKSREK